MSLAEILGEWVNGLKSVGLNSIRNPDKSFDAGKAKRMNGNGSFNITQGTFWS